MRWARVGTVGDPADLGAEFIHGDAPQTTALLREAGLSRIETGDIAWEAAASGALAPADDFDGGPLFERVNDLAVDESVETFLQRFEGDPALRTQAQQARAFVEGFEAADPALASVRAIAEELRSGVDSTSSRPAGGYAPLFTHLAARCEHAGIDVRLRTTVERIDWKAGEVSVTARDAHGNLVRIGARSAIVTLPIGVLQAGDVSFEPPLPDQTRAAIAGLEMGPRCACGACVSYAFLGDDRRRPLSRRRVLPGGRW